MKPRWVNVACNHAGHRAGVTQTRVTSCDPQGIDHLDLAAFGGQRATYTFNYTTATAAALAVMMSRLAET